MAREQVENPVTCALAVIVPGRRVLLAHPTGANYVNGWTLPKGIKEPSETEAEAAARECFEETGLDLRERAGKLRDHGRFKYQPHKDYHLFSVHLADEVPLARLKCESMFISNMIFYPEVDAFTYIRLDQAHMLLSRRQGKIWEAVWNQL